MSFEQISDQRHGNPISVIWGILGITAIVYESVEYFKTSFSQIRSFILIPEEGALWPHAQESENHVNFSDSHEKLPKGIIRSYRKNSVSSFCDLCAVIFGMYHTDLSKQIKQSALTQDAVIPEGNCFFRPQLLCWYFWIYFTFISESFYYSVLNRCCSERPKSQFSVVSEN